MNLRRLRWAASMAAAIVLCSGPVLADAINVASGTTGTIIVGQSYNENRAVDITVVRSHNLRVRSMRLDGLRPYGPGTTLVARIYDSSCAVIAYSFPTTPGPASGYPISVTIPISATLAVGHSYRLAIEVSQATGDLFLPDRLPYIEPSRSMRINNAWDGYPGGACPTLPNLAVPRITVFVDPSFAGRPGLRNCRGQSEAALIQQFGGIAIAAAALGFPSVRGLEIAIETYCQRSPIWPFDQPAR